MAHYILRKSFSFEAAHHLPEHDGLCRRPHGHSWSGELVVKGSGLWGQGPKTGMLIDYADLSAAIKPVIADKLDHHDLNETLADVLHGMPPTSEVIATWLYDYLKPSLPDLVAVVIDETCTSRCEYWGEA
jgi:6-pyruvoyltetrahydropterin/6-carboxytetrahydropterin synthase